MARIRTFIAIDLGERVRARLSGLQEKLARTISDVKWVTADNLHLTLLFLGEVDALEVVSICREVKKAAEGVAPFTMEVVGVGAFPNLRRPKVLWTGVGAGAEELKLLHDLLEAPLLNLGCYRREERDYTPHLTLGRLTPEERGPEWGSLLAKHAEWEGGEVMVDEVLIMSSELQRQGPMYTVMGRFPLMGRVQREED